MRRRVGYVFGGDRGLYERLSGLDNLRYFAELYGVPPREQSARIGELLELVGLTGREERARRGLLARHAAAAARRPRPAAQARGAVPRRAVASASTRSAPASCARRSPTSRAAGTTVLLTTHYMFEADELCDRIAVIAGGRIVAEGTPAELKTRRRRRPRSSRSRSSACRRLVLPASEALPGVRSVVVEERGQAELLVVRAEPGAEVDPGGARLPRRRPAGPGRDAGADAGGRLRRAGGVGVTALSGSLRVARASAGGSS